MITRRQRPPPPQYPRARSGDNPSMLQVCLNGARSPREHHHLPVRPEELAAAAAASVAAGAEDIHLHP
ncbi:3-keto-5-aminohexanoate cleavage protein, partial [Saccharopolyspora erythraea]|uniref:3-keto-5-aminohexanoate cleavage protein n=1 Tax=Saccharopolyspora erythraea TaxID=1836 RepID=UPI00308275C4